MMIAQLSHLSHNADRNQQTELAYRSIRDQIDRCQFRPGKRLTPAALAKELGMSSTPVREALQRLSGRRMIAGGPEKGFRMATPTEDTLIGLYKVSAMLLHYAVKNRQPCTMKDSVGELPRINLRSSEDAAICESVATMIAELFIGIACLSRNEEVVHIIDNINERLRMFRIIECERIPNSVQESKKLSELYRKKLYTDLIRMLRKYHAKRLGLSEPIFNEALRRMYAPS